ncbi:MAG: MBL fold metallo-hydrolase [Bacteroidales bacterium]|nr:MBL fold metallo-hydrolase [Bacteroidales bacterium]
MSTMNSPSLLTVLASGSAGNASLLEADHFGLLIDCGLRPQYLTERLAAAGRSWDHVHAVLLTHTHSDHWNRYTLAHLRRRNIPLIAHPHHHAAMTRCEEHEPLRRAQLTREFSDDQVITLTPQFTAQAVAVPHDSDPTFAFRFESRDPTTGLGWSLGFASDVGHPTAALLTAFLGVDALAIEYNHDVPLQKASRRPRFLIDRVLGAYGHLSNQQASELTAAIAQSSSASSASHSPSASGLMGLVQLHLSRECNHPELAQAAGREALRHHAPSAQLITASQHRVAPSLTLIARPRIPPTLPESFPPSSPVQPRLPGMDAEPHLA